MKKLWYVVCLAVVPCFAHHPRVGPQVSPPTNKFTDSPMGQKEKKNSLDDLPKWTRKKKAWHDLDPTDEIQIMGTGSAAKENAESFQWMKARGKARESIAESIMAHVKALDLEFQRQAVDFLEDRSESTFEDIEQVSRQIAEAALVGMQQTEAHRDPDSGTLYVLYNLPIDIPTTDYMKKVRETFASKGQVDNGLVLRALAKGIKEVENRVLKELQSDSAKGPSLEGFVSLGRSAVTGFHEYRNEKSGLEFVLVPKKTFDRLAAAEGNEIGETDRKK